MTSELFTFSILTLLTFFKLFNDNNKRRNNNIGLYFYTLIILILIYIIRLFPQADMITYQSEMNYPIEEMIKNTYFIKECFFWFTSAFISKISGDVSYTFWFWDTLMLLVLIKITQNFRLPYYFIIFYYSCFPTLLGIENIYRQYIGTTLLILGISYLLRKEKTKSIIFIILSVLTHNSMLLFAPLYALVFPKLRKYWKVIFALTLFTIAILFPIAMQTKSAAETGANLKYAYLGLIFIILAPILILTLKKKINLSDTHKNILIFSFSVYFISSIFLGGIAERIGMICIMTILPIVFYYYTAKSSYIFLRVYLFSLYVLPSFIFTSTKYFLENTNTYFN